MRPAPLPDRFNFAAHLMEANRGRDAKAAYIDDRGTLTYGELADGIRRVAGALAALDVRREERVFLVMHDCTDWPVAFLGAMYAGVVPVAINTLLTADDYAYMLKHCRAQAVIVGDALRPTLEKSLAAGGHEVKHVIVARPQAPLPAGWRDFAQWTADAGPAAGPAPTGPDDIGFWLYSSGSTGRPKGTVHTHGNPYWTAATNVPLLGLREDDVMFSAAKLFFAYGLGNALSFPLTVGATTVLMAERPTPDAVFKRWIERKPTVFFGAPTGYAGMLAAPNAPERGQVHLRMCSSAGEALPRDIGERFTERYGVDIVDGIGSTEMLHVFISNRPDDIRYGTSGKPVDGYEVELRGEDGRPVDIGEVGDLYVKGPTAALMYWGQRDKSRDTFRGEWTRTGDKYQRDAAGYYTYCGRSDDMLKVSGQYVSPFEVEATLVQHPAVLEAAVIGVADEHGLTRTKAYVVLKGGRSADAAIEGELKTFVKERLAPHKYPRAIEFIAELPKTATGKIQRFRLRERETAHR
jgi:benzoate-CoA ligase